VIRRPLRAGGKRTALRGGKSRRDAGGLDGRVGAAARSDEAIPNPDVRQDAVAFAMEERGGLGVIRGVLAGCPAEMTEAVVRGRNKGPRQAEIGPRAALRGRAALKAILNRNRQYRSRHGRLGAEPTFRGDRTVTPAQSREAGRKLALLAVEL